VDFLQRQNQQNFWLSWPRTKIITCLGIQNEAITFKDLFNAVKADFERVWLLVACQHQVKYHFSGESKILSKYEECNKHDKTPTSE